LIYSLRKAKYYLGNVSYTWKSVLQGWSLLEKGCRWRFGDDKSINTCKYNLLLKQNGFKACTPPNYSQIQLRLILFHFLMEMAGILPLFSPFFSLLKLDKFFKSLGTLDMLQINLFDIILNRGNSLFVVLITWLWKSRLHIFFDQVGFEIESWLHGTRLGIFKFLRTCAISYVKVMHNVLASGKTFARRGISKACGRSGFSLKLWCMFYLKAFLLNRFGLWQIYKIRHLVIPLIIHFFKLSFLPVLMKLIMAEMGVMVIWNSYSSLKLFLE